MLKKMKKEKKRYLHTIQERFRDGVGYIRSANEQYFREVVGDVEVVIKEGSILQKNVSI